MRTQSRRRFLSVLPFTALAAAGCWSPVPPAPGGAFRFAVFGDGPYYWRENGRFARVVDALNARPLAFVIHVGDIMWHRCSEEAYRQRRDALSRIRHPVIYTPGDNEWSDCIDPVGGGYDPLDRLKKLRGVFFNEPGKSLGGTPLALESQTAFPEFPEHARWFHGGVMFVTIHVVASANGRRSFPGRTARHDQEVNRRTQAAVAWLHESFGAAGTRSASALVVALHAGLFDNSTEEQRAANAQLYAALVELATNFDKPVLVIHGDEHQYIVDRPFRNLRTGASVANMQRLMTFGSPDIGWVDVVVDPALAEPFRFEPNLTPWWMWW